MKATTSASTAVIQMPGGQQQPRRRPARVRSRSFSHVAGASMRRSSARPLAAPRTSSIVPSVTMNGTTWSRVISRPLSAPHSAPAATPPSGARSRRRRRPARSSSAVTTVLSATMEPTDRSIPPATITIVMPSAATQTMAVCRAISSRFAARKNCGPMSDAEDERDQGEPDEHAALVEKPAAPPTTPRARSRRFHQQGVLGPFLDRPRRPQPAAGHHGDAIAHAEQLGQVAADQQHAPGRRAVRRPRRDLADRRSSSISR